MGQRKTSAFKLTVFLASRCIDFAQRKEVKRITLPDVREKRKEDKGIQGFRRMAGHHAKPVKCFGRPVRV